MNNTGKMFLLGFATLIGLFTVAAQGPGVMPASISISPASGQTLQIVDSMGNKFNPVGSATITFVGPVATPTPTPSPGPTATPSPSPSPSASPTPTPTPGPGIQVACPQPNRSVSSPVSVVAHATPNPGHTITAIRLYVDTKEVLTVKPGADINTVVSMASGVRDLAFVAWDETGQSYKNEFNITVK